jgi:hypothetical protein
MFWLDFPPADPSPGSIHASHCRRGFDLHSSFVRPQMAGGCWWLFSHVFSEPLKQKSLDRFVTKLDKDMDSLHFTSPNFWISECLWCRCDLGSSPQSAPWKLRPRSNPVEAEQFAHPAVHLQYISQKARTLLSIQKVCIELNVYIAPDSMGWWQPHKPYKTHLCLRAKGSVKVPSLFLTNCIAIRVSTNSPFGQPLKARNPRDLSLLRFKEFSLAAKEFVVCCWELKSPQLP